MPNPDPNAAPSAADTDPRNVVINAGDATDAEEALIAQGLETDPATGAPIDAQPAAAVADPAVTVVQPVIEDPSPAAVVQPDPTPAAAVVAPVVAAQPAYVLPAEPQAPKDFAAAQAALAQQYEDGEIETADYNRKFRELTLEEADFRTDVKLWTNQKASIEAAVTADFDAVALDWESRNADFLSNPLRANAMQQAISAVDAQTGNKLSPAELFAQAEKVAFEAYGYTPPAAGTSAPAKTPQQIEADALKGRRPDTSKVPTTLAAAPQSGSFVQDSTNFAHLDAMGIDDLENVTARMTPQQLEAYLADAPGAKSTATDAMG